MTSRMITVVDASTGKPLTNANVQNLNRESNNNNRAAQTDETGLIRLVAKSADKISVSHIAYEDTSFVIKAGQLRYDVPLRGVQLDQVVVFAEEPFNHKAAQGRQDVSMDFLTAVPPLFGEADIIKSLTFLPGVSAGTEGYSHLFVRGGNQDQNLILYDGATLFNVNHFGGFMSMFHSEMIGSVDFYKNYWPSKYGGRLSSIIDIRSDEGNYKEHKQSVDFSLIVPKISASGPLWKDRVSYRIGARRTIADLITGPIIKQIKDGKRTGDMANLLSQDFNARIDSRINDDKHLSISALIGRDKFSYFQSDRGSGMLDENYYRIKNDVVAINFRWHLGAATTLNSHASYSGYGHSFEDKQTEHEPPLFGRMSYRLSGNSMNSWKVNMHGFSRLSDRWELNYGLEHEMLDYTLYLDRSEHEEKEGQNTLTDHFSGNFSNDHVSTSSAYADARYQLNRIFHLNTGLRVTHYQNEKYHQFLFEPKMLATYELNENSTINAAFNLQRQPTVFLGFSDEEGYFREFYTTADERVSPSYSRQLSAGYFRTFDRLIDNLSVEVFLKNQAGITKYLPSADEDLGVLQYHKDLHTEGTSRTFGLELLMQKTSGPFHGSLSYTYAHSRASYPSLNDGKSFDADFDFRHNINLLLIHRFGKGYKLSAQWAYKTGRPFTIPTSQSAGDDFSSQFPVFDEINNIRLPAFHRLDLSLDREWLSKKGKKNWFGIGVYNVYNRVNPFFARADSENAGKLKIHGMFPVIPFFHIGFEP